MAKEEEEEVEAKEEVGAGNEFRGKECAPLAQSRWPLAYFCSLVVRLSKLSMCVCDDNYASSSSSTRLASEMFPLAESQANEACAQQASAGLIQRRRRRRRQNLFALTLFDWRFFYSSQFDCCCCLSVELSLESSGGKS